MTDERKANRGDVRIGQRIRSRRLQIGMSQERLADLLGVTFQQVQKYEKGINRVAATRLFDIAAALDMPVVEFFDGLRTRVERSASDPGGDCALDEVMATAEGIALMTAFAKVPEGPKRKRFVALAEAMAEEGA